uniref:DUF4371 domain-containing protein n=1 Tax=Panagrolaimus superbus TaxID=310955 RepID=A0A914Z3B6_9BILA
MVWIYLKNCMCLGKKHYQDDTEPVLPNSKNEHQNSAAENFDIEIFEDSNTKNCNKELFTELFNNLADLKEKQKFVDGIILTQSGYFAKNCSNDGTIKFYSGDVIANKDKIRKYQTKVKFVSKYGEAICTVINFGGHEMELKFRYLNLSNYGKLNGRFQASLCSNDKQLKHIEEGFRIITRHKEMVEKVWAQNSELIQNGPNMHIFENGRNAVEELIETNDSELTLICAETNDAVKSITAKLKKKMPQMFVDGLAIRLITQKYSNSAEYTKLSLISPIFQL